jgi:integrase
MVKISTDFVNKVQPPVGTFKNYWDDKLKGYGVRVSPKGKKVYIVMGRVRGVGKAVCLTIGPSTEMTEHKAREAAMDILSDKFRKGIDPREELKAAIAGKADDQAKLTTLQDVLDAYVGRPDKLKSSTAAEYRRHVDKVFTAWKDKPIASITKKMVQERHAELVRGGLKGTKAAPASANAAFVTLRILINFARRQYLLADDETPIIRANPVEVLSDHWARTGDRTDRYIDEENIGEVWNALQAAHLDPHNRDALAGTDLTIFALLTGCRRMEAAALTWDRVNIDGEKPSSWWWHLPDPKNGKAIWLPLSSQAVALLKERRPKPKVNKDDPEPSPYVFPSWSKAGHIMDARATMEMVSEVVGKHLSLHDMRRTFTNIAGRYCLIEHFRTQLLTGHKPAQSDVTARNYLDLSRLGWLQPDAQKVADWIEEQGRIAAEKAAAKQAA